MTNLKKNKIYNKDLILILFIPLIVISKAIRYTFMKKLLVDPGIGHGWINRILYEKLSFVIWTFSSKVNTRDNAIAFFQKINFLSLDSYIQWEIFITLIFNIILFIIIIACVKSKLKQSQFIYICLSIVVLNIFDFCLAKEPFQMLYFLVIFIILINKKGSLKFKFLSILLVLFFSAITLRNYFLFVFAYMIVSYFICNYFVKRNKKICKKDLLKIVLFISIIYYFMMLIIQKIDIADYNELIWLRTKNRDANSEIYNIIKGNNLFLFTINYILVVIRLCFPIELVKLGIKYFPFIIYQFFMTKYLIDNLINLKKINNIKKICLYLFIGFILASAMFEPDFGSWVRHEAILFPIMLFLNGSIKNIDFNKEGETIYEKNVR